MDMVYLSICSGVLKFFYFIVYFNVGTLYIFLKFFVSYFKLYAFKLFSKCLLLFYRKQFILYILYPCGVCSKTYSGSSRRSFMIFYIQYCYLQIKVVLLQNDFL